MGSYPNLTATRIMQLLFNQSLSVSGAPSLYGNSANSPAGLDGGATGSGTVTLYCGLLAANFANNTAAAGLTGLNDNAIASSGAGAPIPTGAGQASNMSLAEYTVAGNNMARQVITFTLSNITDQTSATTTPAKVTATGPNSAISFAASAAGASTTQNANTTSVIGFFISTRSSTNAASGGTAPNIIAYGNLSTSRSIAAGDNPTFAQAAISIELD